MAIPTAIATAAEPSRNWALTRRATAACLFVSVAIAHTGEIAATSGSGILGRWAAGFSPRTAAAEAERSLAAARPAEAERLAARALRTAPLSAKALRTLALARQMRGRSEQAAEAMSLAAGLGWRDTPTQLWLIDAYLAQGDVEAALERADALARRGRYRDEMMNVLAAAAARPDGRAAVAARLAQRPPWAKAFMNRRRGE